MEPVPKFLSNILETPFKFKRSNRLQEKYFQSNISRIISQKFSQLTITGKIRRNHDFENVLIFLSVSWKQIRTFVEKSRSNQFSLCQHEFDGRHSFFFRFLTDL